MSAGHDSTCKGSDDAAGRETKTECLLESLQRFYDGNPQHLRTLTDILGPNPSVSLRAVDWLVTNYCKKRNIFLTDSGRCTNMYLAYKNALRSYSKRLLDPFCRRERITFTNADGEPFRTTVGQLNFFRFAITAGIVGYATDNCAAIEEDMLGSIKSPQPRAGRSKRRELSRAAIRSCTRTSMKVTVSFK